MNTGVDLTELNIAKKKIEDSEEQLRIAIEGGEFGTFDFLPKANQLIWSAKTKELFGLPADARVDYETYLAALHPEDRGTSRAIARQQADLKEDGLYELEYRTIGITDDKLRWLRSKGKATYNKEGEAIRYTGVIQDITRQKESAEKIRESNQRFRNIMKQAPVGITILRGPEYIVEMANDTYLRLLDKKEAEFIGNPLFASLPEIEESVHSLLDNVLNSGVPYHGNEVAIPVNRYGKQDISYFDFLYHPLKEEDGKISGVIAIVTEVTEKVEARKKVEDSEKRYNLMLMQSPFAFLILKGKDMVVHLANDSMKEILGKGYDIEAKPLLEVIPEIKGQAFPALLDNVYHTGVPFSANEMLARLTRNGKMEDVYFNYVYQPYYETDDTISGVTVIAYDVTSSVVANKKIEESKQKLDIVIDASELGTYELNLLTDEITCSDKYLEIFGFTEGIAPTHEQLINSLHPAEMQTRNKAFRDGLVSGTLFYQAKILWDDKTIHWIEVKGKVFYDEEKRPVKLIGTVGDITAEKIQQQELTESEKKLRTLSNTLEKQVLARTLELEQKNIDLEKMNKELESFAYISSHDLQEPLRKIQTFATRIKEKEEDNLSDYGRDMFNRMQVAAKRMQTLIQDLLAYSRTNTTERKFETTDLNEIITLVKEDLREELKEKHATIEADHLCAADIIPFQFRQVMHNLIGNSLKFSNQGNPPNIQIKSEIADGMDFENENLTPGKKYCHISFSDNGIGFEQKYSEKIFEVFQRLHGKNEYDGTGIGLSIVKKIIENHHGLIMAKGELNKGATFDIYIPAT
jgi:PAS domain S-box-containing protein